MSVASDSKVRSGSDGRRPMDQHRYRQMRKVSLVALLANLALCSMKVVMGWVTQSQALIADGLHSLADALTDLAVIVTAKFSNEAADAGHPYGHARIETAATAGLGVILIVTAIGIMLDAAGRLVDPSTLMSPSAVALGAAALSIVVNEALFQYTKQMGRKIQSNLLVANAWHHRSDALSSVVVLIGVGGVLLGWKSLDAIAALIVALMIAHIGWLQLRDAFAELVDSGLTGEHLAEIREVIESIEGVQHPHRLRTRRMGSHVLVDVHVQVDQKCSVSEGHQLAEAVQAKLTSKLDDVQDVIVHVDPSEQGQVWLDLPARSQVEADLKAHWLTRLHAKTVADLSEITLHYLDGRIDVDVVIPSAYGALEPSKESIETLASTIQAPQHALPYIGRIRVLTEMR